MCNIFVKMSTTKMCSFCVKGKCDIIVYESWDEMNSFCQYIHYTQINHMSQ